MKLLLDPAWRDALVGYLQERPWKEVRFIMPVLLELPEVPEAPAQIAEEHHAPE